jgi:hypothetical protein
MVASPGGFQVGPATGGTGGMHVVPDVQSGSDRIDATMPIPSQSGTGPRATVPTFGAATPSAGASSPPAFSATISTPATSSPATSSPATSSPATSSPAASGATISSAATNGPASNGGATSDWFRSRRSFASDAAGNGEPPAAGGGRFETEGWAVGKHAAQIIAEPVRGESTAAGLPVRVPQANLIPGSVGGGRRVGNGAPGRSAPGHDTPTTTAPRSRSPEVARNRLSGFQRGVRRAKGDNPRADQGADS